MLTNSMCFNLCDLSRIDLLGIVSRASDLNKSFSSFYKNRQSRTTCSYFCSREIKNRNGLACNPDKTEEDHLCSSIRALLFLVLIDVGGYIRSPIPAAQDLRVLVDSYLMLSKHVKVQMTQIFFDCIGIIVV